MLAVTLTADYGVRILVGPVAVVLGAVTAVLIWSFWYRERGTWKRWDVIEGDIRLGGIGTVRVRPNREDAQIAHSAWVELATRKAGLPFDPENDVIQDVYLSWYELFRELRRLAKSCPAHRLREDEDTCKTVDTMIDALNKGLRPHLTRWHARFRRWFEQALKDNPTLSPQEVQKLFPQYLELILDLQRVNTEMIEYMRWLRSVASGRE